MTAALTHALTTLYAELDRLTAELTDYDNRLAHLQTTSEAAGVLLDRTATERDDAYQALVADLPEAIPFRVFAEEAEASAALSKNRAEQTEIWDRAREQYRVQPRVQAARDSEEFRFSFKCLITEFSVSRESYIEKARNEAVPGYALVTPEGEWVAPGKMGWFGMSSESAEDKAMFKAKCNGYLESLSPDTILVAVDCHI